MTDCKGISTPLDSNVKLTKEDPDGDAQKGEESLYRSMIGSLMYAMVATRPDIAVAIGQLSS